MKLIIGIPSKGRLKQAALDVFASAGFAISSGKGNRNYRGSIAALAGVEVAFLSASEIARELASGTIHLGITGEDLVRENIPQWSDSLTLLTPLGFGAAEVVVAVPEAWIDVENMADLNDVAAEFRLRHGRRLRIATKYWRLTRDYFAQHGIAVYRIVESLGATEGAPAAGQADLIVDITSTGATLEANGLKLLGDGLVLRSQANLVSSKSASWNDQTRKLSGQIIEAIGQVATGV